MSEHFRYAKMARRGIGCFGERELLAERRRRQISSRRIGKLPCAGQATDRRIDATGSDFSQLLNISDDVGNLRRKHQQLLVADLEMRELRDFFYVGFVDWHFLLPEF